MVDSICSFGEGILGLAGSKRERTVCKSDIFQTHSVKYFLRVSPTVVLQTRDPRGALSSALPL